MPPLTVSLQTRYDAVFQSSSDSLFYQNLHHYFDLIEKTPSLKRLIDESQKEYSERHSGVWRERPKTDEEGDVKAELTDRVERFNLYAQGCTMYMRVYMPIEDYKHSTEPEDKQDPVALLMLRGIDRIFTKKWSRERLELYNRWFDGKRPFYEKELRQFHLLLIAAMENMESVEPEVVQERSVPKIPIQFNDRTGDFEYLGKRDTLTPKSQEYKVFTVLLDSEDNHATYLDLIRAMHPSAKGDTKSERADLYKVIRRLEKKIGANVFKNMRRVGYRLVFPRSNGKSE